MESYYRPGTRRGAAMLAVLQAILLLSALVLTPSATIAQDMDAAASDAPQAEQASEPTPEPAPAESQSGPTVEKKSARSSTDSKPEAQSGATSEAGPAEAVADVRLRLFPRKQKLFPGGRKVVSAWACPADIGASFGPDKEPGTKDDDCVAVRAKWSVGPDDAGRLSNVVGFKTRVTLLADSDLQIVAKADGLTGKGTILAKDEPAKVRPQAVDVEPTTVADAPIAAPVADESAEPQTVPVADEPAEPTERAVVEEPVPSQDPIIEEPIASEAPSSVEPVIEEPVASEVPAIDEPTAEPVSSIESVSTEPVASEAPVIDEPVASEAPVIDEPKAAAFALAANDGTLRISKVGLRVNQNSPSISGLAGATFDIWLDDGDGDFEPSGGSSDSYIGQSGATNGSGIVDVSLQPGRYWVREATAPTNWNKISQTAYGSGSSSNQANRPYVELVRVRENQTATTRGFVNRYDNNSYPNVCGLDVALVIDRSGSIGGNYGTLKNAAKSFVDELTGTPSEFRVYSFSWTATTHGGWTSVADQSGANSVKNAIDNLPGTGGGTNWDDAFREVADDGADVIVFLTDGNPTTYGDGSVDGSTVDLIDVELGVASANLAKSQSATPKVVAIGIGPAVANPANLILVSGPTANDDYYVTDFDKLADKLNEIATKLCGGSVTVLKEVPDGNGGWEAASGWTFNAASSGSAPTPQSGATNGNGVVNFKYDLFGNVTATITEDPEPGYQLVQQDGKNAVCKRDGSDFNETNVQNGVQFTLGIDQIVTCTFRNEPSNGTLIVKKLVINDNGGTAVATDFAFDVAGSSAQGPIQFAQDGDEPLKGRNALSVGVGTYTVTETAPIEPGYSVSYDNCANVLVGSGQTKTCTITNNDDPASLTLVKSVINDNGGTAAASAWTLSAGANSVPGSESGAVATTVAGTYALSESAGPDGYTNTSITCDNAQGEVTSVTVGVGESVICTFVNNDDPASLTLVKSVINDNGGTAAASAWTLSAGANSVPGSESGAVATTVAGTYALSESAGPDGYTNTSITCDNAQGEVTSVTVGVGESVICTFVNNDDPASLTLVKSVINDNGGTAAASAWTLSAGANSVPGSESGAVATTVAGTYALSESAGPDGYTNTSITCDNAQGEVTSVTVGVGESVICTFVNNDDPASLTLVKSVINDNGGTAAASAWTLSAGANSVPGSESGAVATTVAGTYALSESAGPDGYTNTSITCDNAQGEVTSVTVGVGESVICTFTNNDDPASLTLVKSVINDNGGTAAASAWTLSAGANSVPGSESGAVATTVAGTYALSESAGPDGYTNTSITCDNAQGEVTSVTVGVGESVICTFTNNDDPASLTLVKSVINDNGGTAAASAWTLSAGANSVPGSESGAVATTVAGTYALSESAGPDGYTNTSITCDNAQGEVTSVTVGVGESVICTFVNNDDPASLTLVKTVSGGSATAADFDPFIDAEQVTWGIPVDLTPGSYTASEVMNVSDYVAGEWGGDCDAQGNVDIALGDTLTCTITNFFAELTIEKSADPAFYGEAGDLISYSITATNSGLATLTGVDISDALIDGLDDWTCAPVLPATLAPGGAVTCTATYEITPSDVTDGSVPNTACVVSDQTSQPVCDDETVFLSELEIVKSADVEYFTQAGDEIEYTVVATNTGEFTLTDVDITDDLIDGLDSWTCTPTLTVAELAAGESITCTATYEITDADVEAGSVLNTACAVSDQTPEVCDDVDVPLAQLEIVKSATPLSYSAVGDEIDYTITATNTGVATLTDVDITDALIDGLDSWQCRLGDAVTDLPVAALVSGQSITCTATYTVTEDDVTGTDPEGFITNVACADSDQTGEVCDSVTTREIVVELIKSVTPSVLAEPGGVFTYTLFIDNESAVPVEITSLVDDNSAESADWAANCAVLVGETLAPDAPGDADSVTCSYTVERTVAGTYPNTAQVTVVDAQGTVATAQDSATVRVLRSELDIQKSANVSSYSAVGDEIVYTITATNTGEAVLSNVDISDALIDGLDSWECTPEIPATLAVGAQITCTATYEITAADIDAGTVFNQACVDSDQTPEICDDVTTPLAELEIVKSANVSSYSAVGDEIVYTIVATNTGEAVLSNVDISDALIDGLDSWECTPEIPATLAVGAQITCTATYEITAADIDAGTVFNQACVDSDQTPEICDDVTTPLAELEIVKSANVSSYSAVGDEIVYTIVATNTGEAVLSNVDISDALIDGLDSWECTPEIPATLAVGAQITCTATYEITAADIDAGTVFNQACVDSDQTPEICDDVTVNRISIVLDKSPSRDFIPETGTEVTFTLAFSHSAQEPPVYMYSLVDDVYGDLLDPANPAVSQNDCPDYVGLLILPDQWYTCQFTAPVTVTRQRDHVNVATITVTDVATDGTQPPERRFATDDDDAVVKLREPEVTGDPRTPPPSQPPTDMLLLTDTDGDGQSGSPFGDPIGWAIWVLLSALVILSTGFVLRRQRFAEVRHR